MSKQHHIGQDVRAVEFAQQVDRNGEVILSKIPAGNVVRFTTKHSMYEYDPHAKKMRGGVLGNEWVDREVAGATFGGSMMAVDRLIPGALVEFYAPTMFTTSPLLTLEVIAA